MTTLVDLVLYHATDASCVDSILKSGFICKNNPSHWLGNGIYFYLDRSLAEWWATNPTSKFGVTITDKRILKVNLSFDEKTVLDLRTLTGYEDCVCGLHTFDKVAELNLKTGIPNEIEKYRCAFFDWGFSTVGYSCVIGSFSHDNKAYLKSLPKHDLEQLSDFNLPFVETQVCVKQGIIKTADISEV